MNKKMIIEGMAERTGKTKKESAEFLNAFMETVKEGIEKNGEVNLTGFVKFAVVDTPAREGIIQMGERKGEKWTKAAGKTVRAKVGSPVKAIVE